MVCSYLYLILLLLICENQITIFPQENKKTSFPCFNLNSQTRARLPPRALTDSNGLWRLERRLSPAW